MPEIKINEMGFAFVCDRLRETEARGLVSTVVGVELFPRSVETTRYLVSPTGVVTEQSGLQLRGVCALVGYPSLLRVLADARVAGYSRESQVLLRPIIGWREQSRAYLEVTKTE